ncbi:hypothetical protein GHO41_11745 [Pseudomonas sp. FSL R10-0399]|uniref:hypothetical protein n=1 Tax=Pseudomonas sp. FSL R10-0399 TaxID=2662194 RepID=UPI001297D5E7|nr:hypothetical protein [Pseudomonas sp. FSL R10-0399]MQT58015.1 hypothetical protein [Pseudomonas sp. FSL R10-0399]
MALHYTISTEKTACGRAATSANATSITADVTCKTCCKSEAYVSAAPAAATAPSPAPAPVVKATPATEPVAAALDTSAPKAKAIQQSKAVTAEPVPVAPVEREASVAFKEWSAQLSNKDRLPRGKFAAHRKQCRSGQSRVAA